MHPQQPCTALRRDQVRGDGAMHALARNVASGEFSDGALARQPGQHRHPEVAEALELRDVTFAYPGADAPVLHGLDLVIEPGTTTAIVGSTGAGKTTLVNLLPLDQKERITTIMPLPEDEASWSELDVMFAAGGGETDLDALRQPLLLDEPADEEHARPHRTASRRISSRRP